MDVKPPSDLDDRAVDGSGRDAGTPETISDTPDLLGTDAVGEARPVVPSEAGPDVGPQASAEEAAALLGDTSPSAKAEEHAASVTERDTGSPVGPSVPTPFAAGLESGVETLPGEGAAEGHDLGKVTWTPAPGTEPFVSMTALLPAPPVLVPPATEEAAAEPAPKRSRFGRKTPRARHQRKRGFVFKATAVVLAVLVVAGTLAGLRATARLPLASVSQNLPGLRVVAGSQVVPWPTGAQSAFTIAALGVSASSGQETPVPIASLTKMMTARIVLADHPLAAGQDGPTITITPDAVALYQDDLNTGQANIEVAVGEVLTERQLLEGMLVHSANNFADLLAIWDAGSVSAFVPKMNAAAAALGMSHTTYTDASGLSTQTMSTPVDQLKLAQADVTNPVFNQIVDYPSVTLPIAGTVDSFTPLIGFGGVVGIKSGFTSAAGGCDVLAMTQTIAGRPVEVLVAVVGVQTGDNVVSSAGLEALAVARAAVADVQVVHVARPGLEVGVATLAGHSIPVVARSGASLLAWPGQRLSESLDILSQPPAGAPAGWRIGVVTAQVGTQRIQFAARTATVLPTPSLFQRVF